MLPFTSDLNFTPSSTALSGPVSNHSGTVVPGHIVYSVDAAVMANTQGLRGVLRWNTRIGHLCGETVSADGGGVSPVIAPMLLLRVKPGGRPPRSTTCTAWSAIAQGCRVRHVLQPVGQRRVVMVRVQRRSTIAGQGEKLLAATCTEKVLPINYYICTTGKISRLSSLVKLQRCCLPKVRLMYR